RTPLYEHHRQLGAKLVDFNGWEMPLQYAGIIEEHHAVRDNIGVFDVSHMGQIEVSGAGALELVEYLVPNAIGSLDVDQARYTQLCDAEGGTLDDLLVYRLPDRYLLVVNAGTKDDDVEWVKRHATAFEDVSVRDASSAYAMVAVQGPDAESVLREHIQADLSRLTLFRAVETELEKEPVIISRTGYTGEDGFEIMGPSEAVVSLWKALMKAEATPIGLGARDTLRLEAALPLYGHELDEDTTPVEAGLGWSVKDKDADYLGKDVLLRQKREGGRKCLVGFRMIDRGVPREGYALYREGGEAGYVTSGIKSPTLDDFLGMGYLEGSEKPSEGTEIEVAMRGKRRRAEVVKLPFYR
ncbi:MAG: glycine cleavage system aminomethyltransferase GcvT, partial [Candidatus Bipolaricaulia bacterium]